MRPCSGRHLGRRPGLRFGFLMTQVARGAGRALGDDVAVLAAEERFPSLRASRIIDSRTYARVRKAIYVRDDK